MSKTAPLPEQRFFTTRQRIEGTPLEARHNRIVVRADGYNVARVHGTMNDADAYAGLFALSVPLYLQLRALTDQVAGAGMIVPPAVRHVLKEVDKVLGQ